jgi:hypothetical protein
MCLPAEMKRSVEFFTQENADEFLVLTQPLWYLIWS